MRKHPIDCSSSQTTVVRSYFWRSLAVTLLALCTVPADAATYYVDVVSGSDAWSGTVATAGTSDGPWRTLAQVTAAHMKPGDVLRLKCGQRWNETLRIGASGTVDKPIAVNSYPDGCTTPAAVDGAESVPSDQWQRHSGNIYKVQFPLSLIPNGNLSQRSTNWRYFSSPADSSAVFSDACSGEGFGCMVFNTSSGSAESLLITPEFALGAGNAYKLSARIKVPAGQSYSVYLRKNSAPWSVPGLPTIKRVGTGAWEDVAMNFTAGESASNARIDIGVAAVQKTVMVREVRMTSGSGAIPITQVFESGSPMTIAHHPNAGQDSSAPESVYLNTGAASTSFIDPISGRPSTNNLITAANEKLPPGAAIAVGNKLFIRTENWSLAEFSVTSISGTRVNFSPNASHPLSVAGWGYFYTGALWMLDSPGEWFYDPANQTLYVWSSDGNAPSSTFSYSKLDKAADLANVSYVNVDGIAFRNATGGIDLSRSTSVRLNKTEVSNTAGYGVLGPASVNLSMTAMVLRNNLTDAVQAPNSTGLTLTGSDIENSGVVVAADGHVKSLPAASYGAVNAGTKSLIQDNRIRNTAYAGFSVGSYSMVSGNAIDSYCLVLNDCGGLYAIAATGLLFENNILSNGRGTSYGVPSGHGTHTNGIYFDSGVNGSTARGNTAFGSDAGMQVHDSRNNVIEGNKFYGNKERELWFQQSERNFNPTLGNIYNNVVRNNQFFPAGNALALMLGGATADPAVFSSFDGNRYSTLVTPLIAGEYSPFGARTYSLRDWQLAVGSNGARALEANGRIAAPLSARALGTLGTTVIPNGALAVDTAGWTRGGDPAPTAVYGACPDGTTHCIGIVASGADSMLSSPRFALTAGTLYRVSFDAATSDPAQNFTVLVRRSGPTTYASLMGDPLSFAGSGAFTRHTFMFKATGSATVSPTDTGARLDFYGVKVGQKLTVTNVELVPINNVVGGNSPAVLLSNTSRLIQQKSCPVADGVSCASYVSFADGTPISWPLSLSPMQTMIVFTQDIRLTDSDGDGVPDVQDRCPSTPAGMATNSAGCARGQ